ncbi:hypothetical protein FA15DRAFT_686677 [Coprinopsis marcescibilis]|nr:hypothetical protein FA15DRAFT_686677 [Coprinopsis marcescibilis]
MSELQAFLALDLKQLGALGILALYMGINVALAWTVIQSIRTANKQHVFKKDTAKIYLFGLLSLVSFASTWYYMLRFLLWSFHDYEGDIPPASIPTTVIQRMSDWLVNSTLFEQAWGYVCFGSMNWWWSEQLLGAWTAFLYDQGNRYQIKRVWAYMILGQLVAISVAANLFYVAILCSKPSTSTPPKIEKQRGTTAPVSPPTTFSPLAWISILLALVTVALTPYTTTKTFLPNLLIMHTLIVLPFLFPGGRSSKYALSPPVFYLLIFLFTIAIRSKTILAALASLPLPHSAGKIADQSPYALFAAAWATLNAHPAQSSIGWDVICASVSFVAWIACEEPEKVHGGGYVARSRWFTVPYLVLSTPLASVGVTAPYVLRPQTTQDREVGKNE